MPVSLIQTYVKFYINTLNLRCFSDVKSHLLIFTGVWYATGRMDVLLLHRQCLAPHRFLSNTAIYQTLTCAFSLLAARARC